MISFTIITTLLTVLMLAVLELNKNSLWGFVLLGLMAVAFVLLFKGVLLHRRPYIKLLGYLGYVALFFGVLVLSWPPTKAVPAYEGKVPQYTEVVSIETGDVQGVVIADGAVELFAGIPYAKAPLGDLRWREPQAPESWTGVLAADHFAPMCMQPTHLPIYDSLTRIIGYHDYTISLQDNFVPPVSEDGLYINLWRPAGGGEKLPVLVYIHGGSLQTGQPWYQDYAGTGLAKEGIIVVNMGYRLGVFGFLATADLQQESALGTTGNYGLLDQIAALKWVKNNVAAFGGDPDNVTLAGESAGAASVSALCTSKLTKGLFRRAILESSTLASVKPPHSYRSLEEALSSGQELLGRYGAASADELRDLDARELVNEAYTQHHITTDGYVLPQSPYEAYRAGMYNEEALLHGYNAEESGPFILFDHANLRNYEKKVRAYFADYADAVLALYAPTTDAEADSFWAEMYGAVFFNYPHYCLQRLAKEQGIAAYEYYFTKTNGRLGCWHSGELPYFYGNIPESSRLFTKADRDLSAAIVAYVANFCRTGDPNGAGLPPWQSGDTEHILELGEQVSAVPERYLALYEILDEMSGWGREP